MKKEGFKKNLDETWVVVDRDEWTDEQLEKLHTWSDEKGKCGFALSNPKFEYWLLLHFEEGTEIASSSACSERLKKHLPNYNKGINPADFTREKVLAAVKRAKIRDKPPCLDWPRRIGGTTVYRLIENMLKADDTP